MAQTINWEKSLDRAFEKAKEQNKVIFIEFYSPQCPYCQKLVPFFQNQEVATLYNDNFINYQLNVETEEAQKFVASQNLDVFGIPYFLFFQSDSTLLHARQVSADVNSMVQPANMVLAKTYSAANYKFRFEQGDRGENFLSHYAIFTRIKKDMEQNQKVVNALWDIFPEDKRASPTSWAILSKGVMDIDNGFVNYWLQNYSKAKALIPTLTPADLENTFSRILYNTLFSPKAANFDVLKYGEIREKFSPLLGEKVVLGLTWEKEVLLNLTDNKPEAAINTGKKAFEFYKKEGGSIVYLSSIFNDHCKDTACLDMVSKWLALAQNLQITNSEKAAYQFEMAKLNRNKNNMKESLFHIQEAINYAKKANIATNAFIQFKNELSK